MTNVISPPFNGDFVSSLAYWSILKDGPMVISLESEIDDPIGTRGRKFETIWHHHVRGQLMCIDSGLVHLRTEHSSWMLQPGRAGWIPPNHRHTVVAQGVHRTLHLLLTPGASRFLPPEPCVVEVDNLTEALMKRAASWAWEGSLQLHQHRLLRVLLEELSRARREPVYLPMPEDRRLLRIANAILDQPTNTQTLEDLARAAGMSPRTANRLFDAELGMSFVQWRQRVMLVSATQRLAQGESVSSVADALGYSSPSNFIAMFKRHFGQSPARYFETQFNNR
jgi:AraC-like DNA-binding protein